jgi:hypothetical protein
VFAWIDQHGKWLVGGLLGISIPLLIGGPEAGIVMTVVAVALALALWTPLREWLGFPPRNPPRAAPGPPARIGYRGTGRSHANLSDAQFRFREGGLDEGIRAEDESVVEAPRARFDEDDDE